MEELKKDLSTKELLRNPDVFADISNVHLFGGEEVIRPEDLEPLPQDMVYRKRKGKLETLMGDVRMRFKKRGHRHRHDTGRKPGRDMQYHAGPRLGLYLCQLQGTD